MNKILKNIFWLILDKVFILILQFLVGVKIVNHYGSEIYGRYSYAMAFVGFSPIFFEILNTRVIKEYYNENNYNRVISVVSTFKNMLAILIFTVTILLYPIFKGDLFLYKLLVLMTLSNVILSITSGIENYFEYKLMSRYLVIPNNIILIISYILQYLGVIFNYSIIMIPIIRVFTSILRNIILVKIYKTLFNKRLKINFDWNLIKKISKDSFYLWISFVSFVIYTQLDKIMIGKLLGVKDVGIYTIALQLINIFSILIPPFQTSIYPKMIELYKNDYEQYLKFYLKNNLIFTWIYILGVISSILFIKYTFSYIYSSEYTGAIYVYMILTISVLFKANGALQTGHMTLKKITKNSFYKTLIGLFLNLLLNLILIPKYGINGAAIATSITQVFTLFVIDFFIPEYREQFFIQLKSFNPLNIRGLL